MATKARKFRLEPYIELVSRVPLVPIESEAALDKAIAFIDELLDKERSQEEELYLDVLSDLVEKYEAEAYPEEPVSDADMLTSLMESHDLTQTAFAKLTGMAESTVSAVLHGTRKLTRAQISRVSIAFNVSADVFDFRS